MEKKITSKDYSDYHSAYSNAFDLNNNGSVSSLIQKGVSSEEDNYLYSYLTLLVLGGGTMCPPCRFSFNNF